MVGGTKAIWVHSPDSQLSGDTMNDQFHKDLASLKLERDTSALMRVVNFAFKMWFVWAIVWLAGIITVVCVVWHFIAKFW